MDLRFYLSLFLRRLHWFLLLAILGAGAGVAVARLLPPVYISRALLVVESQQIPGTLATSTVQVEASEQLQIIQQRIMTRDTLVELANRLEVYAARPGEQRRIMDADAIVTDMRKRISLVTSGSKTPRGPAQATLVNVSFQAPSPTLAAAVANELVTLILRNDVEMRTGVARQTLQFFEQEVARLDTELAERGAAILAFQEANKDSLPESLEFRRSQLTTAQTRLLDLTRAEADLRAQRDRMVRLQDLNGGAGALVEEQQSSEQRQLTQLRNDLASTRAVMSAEHPRVRLLEAQIAALEKIVAQQTSAGTTDAEGRELSAYEIQLAEIDRQIGEVQQSQQRLRDEVSRLQATIEATPGHTISLDMLQRDYDNTRAQYNQTAASRARAETGDTIEAMSKGQRITVIEQAVAPQSPSRPNRPLIAGAGMAGGIFAGLALVVLLEVLKGGIRRPADLTSRLGITPFATLPYLETAQEHRSFRRRIILMIVTVLVLILVAIAVLHFYFMPLNMLLERFAGPATLLSEPAAQRG